MAKEPKKKEEVKEEVKEEPTMVLVTCICSNVHLGNGQVLRCERDPRNDNWVNGDSAEVPVNVAEMLIKKGQCK